MTRALAPLAAKLIVLGAASGLLATTAHGADAKQAKPEGDYTFAIGAFAPTYTAPQPGSYELPPMGSVSDHPLVDASGAKTSLAALASGRVAVVSFIYGSCSETSGCPMSTAVMHRLDASLASDAALSQHVALITVSFDPERDTPAQLERMQQARAKGSSWRFVTAADDQALQSLLDDFGQTITRVLGPDGKWTGQWRHVLKVFLLDEQRRIRNVYSSGFLDAELVRNDAMTVLLERLR